MSYDTEWHYVGESGEPDFENSWANAYAFQKLRFKKGADGVVRIEGAVAGINAGGNTVFILPADYRPADSIVNTIVANDGEFKIETLNINNSGGVSLQYNVQPFDINFIFTGFYIGPTEYGGDKGDKGDTGPGFEDYSSVTTYGKRAVVGHADKAFISKVDSNESDPGDNSDWEDMKGDKGDVGSLDSGLIMAWPTGTFPTGWAFCNGQELDRVTESGLFAVIGTDYGDGDGVDTFNVPDYRGLFLRGAGQHGTLKKANGNDVDGAIVGNKNVDQMFKHKHSIPAFNGGAGGNSVSGNGFSSYLGYNALSELSSNGGEGTPNDGDETYPSHGVINWIIKL